MIRRIDLLEDALDHGLTGAFKELSEKNLEFGVEWLRNLAATALPENEQAYIYIAASAPSEFIAFPLRLNKETSELHALSNYYTSLYAPIVRSADSRYLFEALFRFLAKKEGVSSLTLSPFDKDSTVYQDIQIALHNAGWRGVHTWTCFANWSHTLTDHSYETYFATLPTKLRNTIQRKTRKFLEGGHGELSLFEKTNDLPVATEAFQSVYQQSWKTEEPHPAFIPGLLQLAAHKGWMRLGVASYDGRPVASQLWLVSNNTAFIFKLAYDEKYKKLSPGTVLSAYLMEHVITVDRVTTIDYLTGDDAYKKDWMSTRRERTGIAAYNTNSLKGLAGCSAHLLKTLAKKVTR